MFANLIPVIFLFLLVAISDLLVPLEQGSRERGSEVTSAARTSAAGRRLFGGRRSGPGGTGRISITTLLEYMNARALDRRQ